MKAAVRRIGERLSTRAALGLRPVTAPVMVFIPIGALLGPNVSNLVSVEVLGHLDVVITMALATLGVFIGIAVGGSGPGLRRLFAASTVEAAVTIAVVGGALFFLTGTWGIAAGVPHGLLALALGICASASAAPSTTSHDPSVRRIAARVADLDDVLPIVLGGVVIVLAARGEEAAAPLRTLAGVGVGGAVAAAGLLLLERTSDRAELGVFVLGMLALLGGAAAFLETSPLLTGMAAGIVWSIAPGRADAIIGEELGKVQHPLVVLLLITAGASLVATPAGLWVFAPYVIFRFAGKLLGSWAASRIAPPIAPSDLAVHLVAPGVIGIAFALNLRQVAQDDGVLLFAVSAGAVASELLALFLMPPPRTA